MMMTDEQIKDLWREIDREITGLTCDHPDDDVVHGIIARWVGRQPYVYRSRGNPL